MHTIENLQEFAKKQGEKCLSDKYITNANSVQMMIKDVIYLKIYFKFRL